MKGHGLEDIQRFVLLLVTGTIVSVVARWLRVPYTLALLLLGLGLGLLDLAPVLRLSSDVILLLFLPPLLFEAAFVLDLRLLWKHRYGVLSLAILGVGLATIVAGGIAYWIGDIPWTVALLFGSMVAATDPVAVLAIFRQLGVNQHLSILLEGESLLNDGIALVLFSTLLTTIEDGFQASPAVITLGWSVLGGIAIGLATGGFGYVLLDRTTDHLTETLVSIAVAFGTFLAAEQVHASGVLATLSAGIALGIAGRTKSGLLISGFQPLVDLWAFLAFLANALLFLELGMTVRAADLLDHWQSVTVGIAAALVGRAVVAYGIGPLIGVLGSPLDVRERHVLFWGGLRGAVALAAALSLPSGFPHESEILAMTYGVVLFTLLAQGLTLAPLVRILGLSPTSAH